MRKTHVTKNDTFTTDFQGAPEQQDNPVLQEEVLEMQENDFGDENRLFGEQDLETEMKNEESGNSDQSPALYSEGYTVEGEEPDINLPEKKGFFQGKKGRKRKRRIRIIAILLVLVIVGVTVGRIFLRRRAMSNMTAQSTVRSSTATKGSISTTVVGTGTLETGDAEDVVVPSGIKIDEVLVEAGDTVTEGQTLATVNEASIASALLEVEENLDDVNDQIDDLSDDADVQGTTEYLEALILKGEKKELKEAKSTLLDLMETKIITATKAGIIESVYATEGEELTSSSSSGNSASSMSYSSTDSNTLTASYASYSSDSSDMLTTIVATSGTTSTLTTLTAFTTTSGTADATGMLLASNTANTTLTATKLAATSTETTITIEECSLTITAPATGESPETAIEDADEYTGTISWNPSDSTFQAETTYTATVTLTANEGYIFGEDVNVTISTAPSVTTEISEDGSELTITAVFAATEADSTESTTSTESSSESTTSSASSSSGSSTSSSDSTTSSGGSSIGGSGSSGNSASGSGGASSSGLGSGSSSSSSSSSSSDSSSSSGSSSDYSVYEAVAFSIVDDDTAVISVSVDELDILSVEEGQTAVVTMDAVEDEEFEGTITSVSTTSSGDSSSAKYPVEITIEKTENMMYGMSASVTINIDEATDAILIPVDALQEEGSSTYVYTETDDEGNLSGRTEVTTGLSNGTQVAITSGLEEGDTVYYEETTSDSSSDSESGFSFDMNMGGGDMPSSDRDSNSSGGGRGNSGGGMSGGPGGNQ
ncbi:MAG: HlyD family efflux transporter periplasmic adaptor subunit [Clostridiales bacterium]|nr:HlyD family efflux transporter periplasmic adaptor subunit [Clostridiales bacterium]